MITSINIGKTHKIKDLKYPIRVGTPYHLSVKEVAEI